MNEIASVMRHRHEFARAIRNRNFEITPAGVLFPQQGMFVGGVIEDEHRRGGDLIGRQASPNIMPLEARNLILDTIAGGATQVNPWYVAPFAGNVTPDSTLTGATFASVCTEFTDYDETTRVAYVEAAASAGAMDNGSNRAVFTINATGTIYGAALLSASAKSDATAGSKCLAAARFAASRSVVATDELAIKYTLSATSS